MKYKELIPNNYYYIKTLYNDHIWMFKYKNQARNSTSTFLLTVEGYDHVGVPINHIFVKDNQMLFSVSIDEYYDNMVDNLEKKIFLRKRKIKMLCTKN